MTKKRAWVSFDSARLDGAQGVDALRRQPRRQARREIHGVRQSERSTSPTRASARRSRTAGLETVTLDPDMKGLMTPVFSPDGKHFAAIEGGAVQTGSGTWYHDLTGGKLVMLDFDESTVDVLEPHRPRARERVSDDRARARRTRRSRPTRSSSRSTSATTRPAATRPAASTPRRKSARSGSRTSNGSSRDQAHDARLTAERRATRNLSFEPTFNPIERGDYFWVVFTSERDWGNRITGTANNGKKRLWVAAIDRRRTAPTRATPRSSSKAKRRRPPTCAASGRSRRASRRRAAARAKPASSAARGFCDTGVCVDTNTFACKQLGDSCTTASDCCNDDKVSCLNGVCAVPPVN